MTKTIKTNDNSFVARFECTSEGTRYGFRHLCILIYYDLNDEIIDGSAHVITIGLGKVIRIGQSCAALS